MSEKWTTLLEKIGEIKENKLETKGETREETKKEIYQIQEDSNGITKKVYVGNNTKALTIHTTSQELYDGYSIDIIEYLVDNTMIEESGNLMKGLIIKLNGRIKGLINMKAKELGTKGVIYELVECDGIRLINTIIGDGIEDNIGRNRIYEMVELLEKDKIMEILNDG